MLQTRYQLIEMAQGFNGYNGEIIIRGMRTRLEMSGAIDKEIELNPQTGNVSHDDAEKLMLLATDILNNSRNGDK